MFNEENMTMDDLLNDYDVKRLTKGQILKGNVIEVNDKEAFVNINYAFDGVIKKEELSLDDRDPREVLNEGDEIQVYVLSPNDGEGYVELSLIRASEIKDKEYIKNAFDNQSNVKVKIDRKSVV